MKQNTQTKNAEPQEHKNFILDGIEYEGTEMEITDSYEIAVTEQNCNVDFDTYVKDNCQPITECKFRMDSRRSKSNS